MKTYQIYVICLFLVLSGNAQSPDKKIEREKRIVPAEVPEQMLATLKPFTKEVRHVRYYQESGDSENYEAKFRLDGKHYSIEFSNTAKLEDVEVGITWDQLPPQAKEDICTTLLDFDRHRIVKIQKQFSSSTESDAEVIRKAIEDTSTESIKYEMIADLKLTGSWQTFELLFSEQGHLLSKKEVVERDADFILY